MLDQVRAKVGLAVVVVAVHACLAYFIRLRNRKPKDLDHHYMELAIKQAYLSTPIESAYCVGCIVVKEKQILSTGYSRELPGNTHAEQCALMKLGPEQTKGSTVYTTMEPCSERLSGNKPCVQSCIQAHVKRVVIGAMEPARFVNCRGVQQLQEAGIQVDLMPELSAAALAPNAHLNI